jgi:small subunit ribosomal protein S8
MSDAIAEMLTKIRNAQMAGHPEVSARFSKNKLAIAKILEREGFIEQVSLEKQNNFENIKIFLKYYQKSKTEKAPSIKGIKQVSKQGQRIYIKNKEVKKVKSGYGVALISTSKGIMTDEEARKAGLGGEYICEMW